jgi:hypothetical protein
MAKRRFLPTRRELYQYINGEISDDDDEEEEDKSHLNTKRYFLKSKRYFLNSKRDNERREVRDSSISFNPSLMLISFLICFFRNKRSSTALTSILTPLYY